MHYTNLVFEGGGARGVAFAGAIKAMEQYGILKQIKRLIGSSAGAIIAGAIAIGYDAEELCDMLKKIDLNDFKDDSIGIIADLYRFFRYYGLYKGDYFLEWYGDFLKKKTNNPDITFKEVYERYGRELVVTGSCVNKKRLIFFEKEKYPDMPIRLAIRISMSIPYLFKPVTYCGDIYVDGGMLNNYPIWYFKDVENTLGFKLVSQTERKDDQIFHDNNPVNNIVDFSKNIVSSLLEEIERLHVKEKYWKHTVCLDTFNLGTMEFTINDKMKDKLTEAAYKSTVKFLTE